MTARAPRLAGLAAAASALALLDGGSALAKRAVEIHFTPAAGDDQVVVWIEDATGRFVDTAFITRTTGTFGLGNRPGTPLLKSDFRWPYGRREMVAPVWAHRRDHHYPKVVMGGVCGNAPSAHCPDGAPCEGDCVDSTIAYHSRVSSYEPFFCSPSGASRIDAMSCASKGTFSKGAFADAPADSLYPPRADLDAGRACAKDADCASGKCQPGSDGGGMACAPQGGDSQDTSRYAALDDLVAISGATPTAAQPFSTVWLADDALPDGDYVAWVEVSEEADFNSHHRHASQADTVAQWNFEGHDFLGQPSIVYRVPFRLDGGQHTAATGDYAGYGAWDGQDGMLRGPDDSITSGVAGTGAGRLLADDASARVTVLSAPCPSDMTPPDPVDKLTLAAQATSIEVRWTVPTTGVLAQRFDVRYREGAMPIGEADFDRALAPTFAPPSGAAGAQLTTTIAGLTPDKDYTVAVRGRTLCGARGGVVSQTVSTPAQSFTTLHGCFVATAAFGQPGDRSVAVLRGLRDRRLLDEGNVAGRLFVTLYYAAAPPFADAIAHDEGLRAAARALLAPLVELAAALD